MRDIVYEWYVPYVPGKRELLIQAVLISAALVFLFDAVFFASGMLVLAALCGIGGFLWSGRIKLEYEYVYVNGDFTVSRIIRKAKRKDVYHVMRTEIEEFSEGRKERPGEKALNLTSGRPKASVYTLRAKGQTVWIEPSEEFIQEMKKYRFSRQEA